MPSATGPIPRRFTAARRIALWSLLLALPALVGPPSPAAAAGPPATPRRPAEDVYWGRSVREDYRWLEDWNDSTVRRWSAAQNAYARATLDRIPGRADILARVEALTRPIAPSYSDLQYRRGVVFALKDEPPKQQPFLVRLRSVDDVSSETVLLDPNRLDPDGGTSIDFFVPSFDGARVAVSLSQGGSESGTVVIVDSTGARLLADSVPGVNGGTAGGDVAWAADGSGFYYTRYPQKGERPDLDLFFYQQVYGHRLGTPASADTYAVGRDFPKIAETTFRTSEDGRTVLADVRNGDGGEHSFWLGEPGGGFRQVTTFADSAVYAEIGDSVLYLLSTRGAPKGRVLRLVLEARDLASAEVIVPENETAIEDFTLTASRLYLRETAGGPSEVRAVDLRGTPLGPVGVPPLSAVSRILRTEGDAVLLERQSFTEPRAWYRFDPASGALAPTALAMRSPADFSDLEVRREFATSADGTRVPMFVLLKKGAPLDGRAPTLLQGYGGFGITEAPGFSAARRVWFDQGGVFALANLRGGGEFGDAWHGAGYRTRKQNVFDDFAACARHLIARGYTTPARLVAEGGSNGGLLMGAMITQHPDLFRAVVSHVGIYDMLRYERSPNGLFNTTEYGTVRDSAQFAALYAYSPYHHVVDGTKYPAVLFLTGANDPRVDPANSRKMTARLRAAGGGGAPVLLRTSGSVGHGVGSPYSQRVQQQADVFAFLFKQLGIPYRLARP